MKLTERTLAGSLRFDRVGSRLAIAAVAVFALACGQSPRGAVAAKPEGNAATVVGSSGSESSVVTSVTGHSMTMSQEDPRRALPRPSAPCGQGSRAQWTPPASLNRELGHAAAVLVELGLTDPRGLRLVNARVFAGRFAGNDAPTPAMGWLVSARDDAPAMLLSLRGDLVALDGEASTLAQIDPRRVVPSSGWTAMRRARA